MKIERRGVTFVLYSKNLCDFVSIITGFKTKSKAIVIPPFLILIKNEMDPKHKEYLNHELIHIKQFKESLGLIWFIALTEYFYARIFLKYSHMKAYKYECIEQEAYLNMNNLHYLKTRKFLSTLKYIKYKNGIVD